jgi:hypothetical protein
VDLGVPRSSRGVGTTRGLCLYGSKSSYDSTKSSGLLNGLQPPVARGDLPQFSSPSSFPGGAGSTDIYSARRWSGRRKMGETVRALKGLPGWPTRLSDEQAASYVGLSIKQFLHGVATGELLLGRS